MLRLLVNKLFAIAVAIAGFTIASISVDNSITTTELIYFHAEGREGSCPTICESFADINPMYGTFVTRKDCYFSKVVAGYCTVIVPTEEKIQPRHSKDYYNTLLRGFIPFSKPEA